MNDGVGSVLRVLYVFVGGISLVLGVVGLFLPLLPTTPFLLLSAWCFSRGSRRFHFWLLNHPVLGVPIRDWQQGGVIRPRIKWLVTVMLFISAAWMLPKPSVMLWAKLGFGTVAVSVLLFVWTRPGRA